MSVDMRREGTTAPASERALEAALPVFARVGGAAVHDDGDLRRIASGRPYASFNHVYAVRLGADDAAEARIRAAGEAMRDAGSVPATWWIGPSTRPGDLARRLTAAGLREDEPEFGMVIDPSAAHPQPDAPRGATVARVTDDAGLRDWTEVMGASYGWRDPAKADAVLSVYRPATSSAPWVHLLVRLDGEPVACGSLFLVDGHAFVTNIGTVPAHRGRGLGSLVTSATLDLARERGHRVASLTASVMGRSMYARLGFRDDARFERYLLES